MFALAALALAPRAWAQQAAPVPVPFQIIKGKIFIDIVLAGRTAEAMVDTGAGFTGVDTAFAESVGIVGEGRSIRLDNLQGGSRGRWSRPVPLVLGPLVSAQPLLITDFGLLTSTVLHPIRMVLGADFLSQFVVEFDFDAGVMTLHPHVGFSPPPAALVALAPRPSSPVRMAQIQVEGQTIQAIVDTGSQSPLIVSPGPARRIRLTAGRTVSTSPIGSFGGSTTARITAARQLDFGGHDFSDVPVQIAARDFGAEGNLGLDLLSRFHLWLDLSGKRMWLAARTDQPRFHRDLLGFYGLQDGDDHLRVTFVARNSPAERAGLKAHDIITRINGEPAFPAQMRLDAREGLALALTLESGETRDLTLARYY